MYFKNSRIGNYQNVSYKRYYFCGLAFCNIAVRLWHFASAFCNAGKDNMQDNAFEEHFILVLFIISVAKGRFYRHALILGFYSGIEYGLLYFDFYWYLNNNDVCFATLLIIQAMLYIWKRRRQNTGNASLLACCNYYFNKIFCRFHTPERYCRSIFHYIVYTEYDDCKQQ